MGRASSEARLFYCTIADCRLAIADLLIRRMDLTLTARRVPDSLDVGLHDQQLARRDAARRRGEPGGVRRDVDIAGRTRLGRAVVDDGEGGG